MVFRPPQKFYNADFKGRICGGWLFGLGGGKPLGRGPFAGVVLEWDFKEGFAFGFGGAKALGLGNVRGCSGRAEF